LTHQLTLFAADSHANRGRPPASAAARRTLDTCGPTWPASSMRSDRPTSSPRTSRSRHSKSLSMTFSDWATASRQHSASVQRMLVRHTSASDGGCWLSTPTAADAIGSRRATARKPHWQSHSGTTLTDVVWNTPMSRDWKSGKSSAATKAKNSRPLPEQVGGSLNPLWVEWLMGWPLGWTDCTRSATDRCQQWRQLHGAFCGDRSRARKRGPAARS